MAIRIRTTENRVVALCAAQTEEKDGDKYLNDAEHHALTRKFEADFMRMGFLKHIEGGVR